MLDEAVAFVMEEEYENALEDEAERPAPRPIVLKIISIIVATSRWRNFSLLQKFLAFQEISQALNDYRNLSKPKLLSHSKYFERVREHTDDTECVSKTNN